MEGMGGAGTDPRYLAILKELSTGMMHTCAGPYGDDPKGLVHITVKNYPILGIPVAWSTGKSDTRYKDPKLIQSQEYFQQEVRELLQAQFGWTHYPLMAKPRATQFETWFCWNAFYVYKEWGAFLESADVTNLNKSLEDAMTGLLWKDDNPGYVHDGRGAVVHFPSIDRDSTFFSFSGTFIRGKNKPPSDAPAPGGSVGGDGPHLGGGLWTPGMN